MVKKFNQIRTFLNGFILDILIANHLHEWSLEASIHELTWDDSHTCKYVSSLAVFMKRSQS